jgi:hypothetical protein
MIYFARSAARGVRLAAAEHYDIRWFGLGDLDDPEWRIPEAVRFYAGEAIRRLSVGE